MMRTPRFQIVMTTCRRCGKPLATGNRSLFGADALKAQFDRVCEGCTTNDDRAAMDAAMRQHMEGRQP